MDLSFCILDRICFRQVKWHFKNWHSVVLKQPMMPLW
jgi:hypothetical protein